MRKYGLKWPDKEEPLEIERYCIRKGGKWTEGGNQCGAGLFHHYREMETILWPDDYHNRWTDWELRILLEERIAVFGGSKDSGKTRRASKWALMDYWCFPHTTLILMTSTTNRGLELRVWGDIKSLFQRALDKFSWLEGNAVDSKHGIFTDAVDDESRIRDMRRGIIGVPCMTSEGAYDGSALTEFAGIKQVRRRLIGDECFPTGTTVDTMRGPVPIERIVPGDKVFCASGTGTVIDARSRYVPKLVTVVTQDGRKIRCTPDHPFLTQFGWVKACELNEHSYILSVYESMQILRQADLKSTFLFKVLHSECLAQRQPQQVKVGREGYAFSHAGAGIRSQSQPIRHYESDRASTEVQRGQRNGSNSGRVEIVENGAERDLELWDKDRQMEWERISACLQSRCGATRTEACNPSRWVFPHNDRQEREGYQKRQFLKGTWVDRVEVQKSTDNGLPIPSPSARGHRVYNLQVDQHPSYSVLGLLAHNCQFMSVDYLKILFAMDAGDFKGAFLGNMIAENGKALDRIAEPVDGWGSEGDVKKTTQWRNKYGGVTLNLVGIDSPNLDPETKNKFPGMITQSSIDRAAALPGAKDSVEWWSQIMGVRKVGVVSDRVLMISDITNNGGFEDVIWASTPQRGLAIDAGYGGDDCVKTYFEFGEEVSGKNVLVFKEQGVYPVAVSSDITPEDQISNHAKADCDRYDIPYSNVYIEAGMRATLAVSFGRILSPSINAINFGGTSTDRPVSNDLFVFDEKAQQRRLKTCREHYSKFVTELAFSVRDLVMCGQARKFPMPAAEEFQKRKWEFVYGDRYELETKIEYKERNASKSPNFSDSIMIAVEGARRLGFQIERPASELVAPTISVTDTKGNIIKLPLPGAKPKKEDQWMDDIVDSQRKFARQNELSYD